MHIIVIVSNQKSSETVTLNKIDFFFSIQV